ncbi:MAG: hypothetical protein LLF94_07755 [Chlamydiales bacterium]|nr:hypothetical protein [Chlamydiales bacterium]
MSLVNIAAHFENRQLPEAVLEISKTGEERLASLYKKISDEMQEDLHYLKRGAISSVLMLKEKSDVPYWTDLALNHLSMLHAKIKILERLTTFGDLIKPNKSLEIILGFCKEEKHEATVRSFFLSLPQQQRTVFCKNLETFFFCFETPTEAVTIINCVQEYPANERAKLVIALMDLFKTKSKLHAIFLLPLIPNIYMLLDNPEKIREVGLQCQTFEEVQAMLTK